MNTANYKNRNNKYPVSTDTFDFIQEQIKLIYHLSDLYGQNFILQAQSGAADGIVVVNGEVMPLQSGSSASYITVYETYEDVTAGGQDFEKARIRRYAAYTAAGYGANSYSAADFETLQTVSALRAALAEAEKHHQPKGSIQLYYGAIDCDSLPYGWVPCGFYTVPSTTGILPYQEEIDKWRTRYGTINYTRKNNGIAVIRITSITIGGTTITIPDLSGRFPVAAGTDYALGDTGGSNTVTLTAAQSGVPAHRHSFSTIIKKNSKSGISGSEALFSEFDSGTALTINDNTAMNASAAHENRPPYFALNMLMKVI